MDEDKKKKKKKRRRRRWRRRKQNKSATAAAAAAAAAAKAATTTLTTKQYNGSPLTVKPDLIGRTVRTLHHFLHFNLAPVEVRGRHEDLISCNIIDLTLANCSKRNRPYFFPVRLWTSKSVKLQAVFFHNDLTIKQRVRGKKSCVLSPPPESVSQTFSQR